MRYLLGTEAEGMSFSSDGIEYGPSGPMHVIDTKAPNYRPGFLLGYAVCGRAVRIWQDRPVKRGAEGVPLDDVCAAAVRR